MVAHGSHLRLSVRPEAPVQILLTGHMDTVFPADHGFQALGWIDPATLNGPRVAAMKGRLAFILAALRALATEPTAKRLGYYVLITNDEKMANPLSSSLFMPHAS